ncbi:MAG: nitronate monooxygenase [Dehalococcoidia bacterium]
MARGLLHTSICDELGIEYPIFLAGMSTRKRVPTPPELVAAVSEAGGLGVLGCSSVEPEEVRQRIHKVRSMTSKPFGVDLLLPASRAEVATDREAVRAQLEREFPGHVAFVRSLREKMGLPEMKAEGSAMSADFIEAQVRVVLEERVPVFAAALGDPAWVVPLAREVGTKVIGLAGSVRNAERQKAAGVDIIVAQGTEAGGHTGRIATMPLVPQVVDAVAPTPVLAAGGIADGRGVVAALALGAVGAWCGTVFLMAEESGIFPEHQDDIARSSSENFVVTRAYTGKTARDVRNVVIDEWEKSGLPFLPMPLQGVLMDDLTAAAEELPHRSDQQPRRPDRRHAHPPPAGARDLRRDGGSRRGHPGPPGGLAPSGRRPVAPVSVDRRAARRRTAGHERGRRAVGPDGGRVGRDGRRPMRPSCWRDFGARVVKVERPQR